MNRKALQINTVLQVRNHQQGLLSYTIQREIGRGSSCIVYDGYYLNNTGDQRRVRIKECYPRKLNLKREDDGSLSCEKEKAFSEKKEEFCKAFQVNNLLAGDTGLTNRTSNTVDLYEANHTYYIVTAYVEGKALTFEKDRSLRSLLTIAKSVAAAVGSIHDAGFLYLDLKPANVFLYKETEELIQLFDFDSPISMEALVKGAAVRLSRTDGFAPLELLQGDRRKIGPWTDVYSLGVLVYYLLFGRLPYVSDSDEGAVFSYKDSIFKADDHQDRMEILLTEFLHKTLAGYYRDRYQSMEEAKIALEEMLPFADPDAIFLHSTRISEPVSMIGREKTLQEIRTWWDAPLQQVLYITGMGGIGKSTLVRKAVANLEEEPKHLLFLSMTGQIQRIVADDTLVSIHGISRLKEESEADYFERKISVLKKLSMSGKSLLILDDFAGEIDSNVQMLLDLGWKTVIISRENRYREFFTHLPIGPLDTEEEQRLLFEQNLERGLTEYEEEDFQKIRRLSKGHTLVLELLGRQIRCSFLSIEEAAELVEKQGFSGVSEGKIDFARNQHFQYDSIRGIIQEVFAKNRLSELQRVVLKEVTLFYLSGLEIETQGSDSGSDQEFLKEESYHLRSNRDRLETSRELEKQGWLTFEGHAFYMHPLIYEVVDSWEWQSAECERAVQVMEKQFVALEKKQQTVAESLYELNRAEQILHTAWRVEGLRDSESCFHLTGAAVGKMPPDREAFILLYGQELLKNSKNRRTSLNERQWMKICDMVSYVLLKQKNVEAAKQVLHMAKKLAGHDSYAKALYYGQAGQFYDEILDGQYDPAYRNSMLAKLMDAQEKEIRWMKKADTADSRIKTVGCMLQRVLLLSRAYPEKKQLIRKRLYEMKAEYDALEEKSSELEYTFAATLGWYYTYVEQDPERADRWMKKAKVYAEQIYLCDLDLIDFYYIPYANMKLECRREIEKSAALLKLAQELCDLHADIPVYQRKKEEVQGYLDSLTDFQNAED